MRTLLLGLLALFALTTPALAQVSVTSGPNPTTGTMTSVNSSATAVTVLASNTARRGAAIVNDSTAIAYCGLSNTTPTASLYTVALDAKGTVGAYYEVPYGFTGAVQCIWASANGAARVTEFQ